jgi:hypothetical protein
VGGLHTVKSYLSNNSTWEKTGKRHQQSINILHNSSVKTVVIVRQSVAMQWVIIKLPSIKIVAIIVRIRGVTNLMEKSCEKGQIGMKLPCLT